MAFSRHVFTRGGLQSLRAYTGICMSVFAALAGPQVIGAQVANRLPQSIDTNRTLVLQNHHPQWASAANSIGAVSADAQLNQFTLVLSRSAAQEQAFEQLLADQQNPASPEYHHWLTPLEVGARFGVSDADVAAIEGWLQSQGLHVNWVSASRIFVGFGGSASNVGRAFGTELRYYNVNGTKRMSVAADPVIPRALVPVIGSIRGLYDIDDRPAVRSSIAQSVTPAMSLSNGTHFVSPNDFNTIYDVPEAYTGAGVTVGIVSWSRTNFADFANFRSKTGTSFQNPTEIVPTAFGGIDPGPAYTTSQSCSTCLDGQTEATLDVERVGSTAQGADILLMVSSSSGSGGGIGADAQYLVNTDPVPAQVMSISFGGCEANAGSAGVAYWNSIFQQAAAEGISVFVSSGDSGAAGCDAAFSAPPSSPGSNSPNYICSSQYATCLGGTQFNDSSSASTYWNSGNSSGFASAIGYIPEGGWNESTSTSVAASGGGVSRVIRTPRWQTGTGVPAQRAGRYTPDLSFTAAGHDGYFGCLAASGGSCAGSPFNFIAFEGTSATAPGMAGIAALLDQRLGSAQGNLNPVIYAIAASNPAVFHDVTVATSGVANCDVGTASMCNNSIPSQSGNSAGQPGYLVGVGFDEVTGLGSLDVNAFLNSIAAPPTINILATPSSLTFPTEFLGYSATAQLAIQNSGSTTLNALAISIDGANAGDFSQTSDCQPSLNAGGGCTIQVTFTPTAAGSRTASLTITSSNASNSPQAVPLTGTGSTTLLVPSMFAHASPTTATTAQPLTVSISAVHPEAQYPTPTGSVQLT
jgi:pseudomonalisin